MQNYNFLRVAEHPVKKAFERGIFLALLSGFFYFLLVQNLILLNVLSQEIRLLTVGFLFVLIPLELIVKHNHLSHVVFDKKYLMYYENSLFGSRDHLIQYKDINKFSYKTTILDKLFDTITLTINDKKLSIPEGELDKIKNAAK
jgi:hypothetical protein